MINKHNMAIVDAGPVLTNNLDRCLAGWHLICRWHLATLAQHLTSIKLCWASCVYWVTVSWALQLFRKMTWSDTPKAGESWWHYAPYTYTDTHWQTSCDSLRAAILFIFHTFRSSIRLPTISIFSHVRQNTSQDTFRWNRHTIWGTSVHTSLKY